MSVRTTIETLARRQVAGLRDEAGNVGDTTMHGICVRVLAAYDAQAFGWPAFLESHPEHGADVAAILEALEYGGQS